MIIIPAYLVFKDVFCGTLMRVQYFLGTRFWDRAPGVEWDQRQLAGTLRSGTYDKLKTDLTNVGITIVVNQPCLGDGEKNRLYIPTTYGDLWLGDGWWHCYTHIRLHMTWFIRRIQDEPYVFHWRYWSPTASWKETEEHPRMLGGIWMLTGKMRWMLSCL